MTSNIVTMIVTTTLTIVMIMPAIPEMMALMAPPIAEKIEPMIKFQRCKRLICIVEIGLDSG